MSEPLPVNYPLPGDITVLVVMVGETEYWRFTSPFIEHYCRTHGYVFRVFREDCLPTRHPSWCKLLAASCVATSHVIIWDADLVPMPDAPPIHESLSCDRLAMVWVEPSRTGRLKLRHRYGRDAAPQMQFNCGLISIPHGYKKPLRDLFFNSDHDSHIFWEQGAVNYYVVSQNIQVDSLDGRWNCIVHSALTSGMVSGNYCLHFAKGPTSKRMRRIGRLYRILRRDGRLPPGT